MTTIRIAPEKQSKLDEIAAHHDRSRNYIINEAIDQYLATQEYHMRQIKLAIKEADEGKFASNQEMQDLINSYRD